MKTMMFYLILCFLLHMVSADSGTTSGLTRTRESRKLFGGYRITPKYCKATRSSPTKLGGPNICMFNHECIQRKGEVVGACMDGFLFGACCQIPKDEMVGDLLQDYPGLTSIDNKISQTTHRTTPVYMDITSHGVSQIAASLLGGNPPFSAATDSVFPTGQAQTGVNNWSTTAVQHSGADTDVSDEDNEINSNFFSSTKHPLKYETKQTTVYGGDQTTTRYADTYPPPILQISVSNAPLGYTPLPTIQRPQFRPKPPKPTDGNYVLIPTLTHQSKVNRTEENIDAIVESVSLLNPTSTNRPLATFSYVSSSTASSTRRPATTTRKPPSTSYVFSTTIPPRRTEPTTKKSGIKRKPVKTTSFKPPSTSYVYSSTFRPTRPSSTTFRPSTYSTFAHTPEAFPQSTSTYGSTAQVHNIAGPSFTVTGKPQLPSPPPTLIVLGPVADEQDDNYEMVSTSARPASRPQPAQLPQKKPAVNHVTINNHVTQNIYSTQRPQTSSSAQNLPSPTVIITPKPTISSSYAPPATSEEDFDSVVVTSANDMINFPPDRNPNLNISSGLSDDDITTPTFVEDEAMNEKVESFVNQIIYGLQEPFDDLKDIVYGGRNGTTAAPPTTKPVKKQGTTSKKPTTVKTTRKPATTRRPVSTTNKIVTTKKPATTTLPNFIENEADAEQQQNYRDQCGIRPLVRAGRIVGGRGAVFGEFPWQVLVRESTWLGLFTKNKCGGVLISDKFVITAAHCQPGFLASLVAVFGEYDISGDLESRKPVSKNVKRVILHRKYDAATFENDLALLELESPVTFDAHIIPICLPPDNADYTKTMATVTGWGRLKYGGGIPSVLQEVQVPIMENSVCQEMFRTAGHTKVILDSFLCAGYANGQKDACEGDSGGPLVVERPDGRYVLAGTVSHGIKCAAPYLPGVYMRTTYYKPWITSITGIE